MKYWVAVGTPENWSTAFNLGNTWGLKDKGPKARSWREVQIGDGLIFYAVSPVKGIIGYGVVQQKRQLDELLSGTFHEIRDRIRVLDEATVKRLMNLKREVRDIESRLGITLPAP